MTMVLLAHSYPAVRAWVQEALSRAQDVEFVAEASDGEEAWHLALQVRWHVTLIACSLPGTPDGAAAIMERAQAASIGVRLLVLGTPEHDGLLYRLWRAGALGWIPEEAAPLAIVEAVQAAARGRSLWTPGQIAQAQRWWDEVGCKLEMLTERERQVLALVTEGLSNRQIAERFSLSVNTVRTHVRNVLGKLGVNNRLQAAMFLVRETNVNQTSERIIHCDQGLVSAYGVVSVAGSSM